MLVFAKAVKHSILVMQVQYLRTSNTETFIYYVGNLSLGLSDNSREMRYTRKESD